MSEIRLLNGDCIEMMGALPEKSIQCCVTSPPYWGLRDYGVDGQLGLEETPEEYVEKMVEVFRGVWRVLRDDGTLWLVLGDSYANDGKWGGSTGGKHAVGQHGKTGIGRSKTTTGLAAKNLVGIPWRVAFALQSDGWILRQDIVWHKPNPMPESVTDRCTKAHEYIFLCAKSNKPTIWQARDTGEWSNAPDRYELIEDPVDPEKTICRWRGCSYYFDHKAMQEPGVYPKGTMAAKGSVTRHKMPYINGRPPEYKEYTGFRNKRSVWTVTTKPFKGAHFATFPRDLIQPCIEAGCPVGGTVLDPFGGSGTVALVCQDFGRSCVSIELNAKYHAMGERRVADGEDMLTGL